MNQENNISSFLNDKSSKALVITGGAGTGKTTLVKKIIKQLNQTQRDFYLLAPTGRASLNLYRHVSDITNVSAQTIHSFLYKKIEEDNEEVVNFKITENELAFNAVIIIDEASMLSYEKSRSDFLQFGSGNIFQDLLGYLKLTQSDRQLILIGDPYQLPPVNVSIAKVLQPDFLTENNIPNVQFIYLDKVYRQAESSKVLENATALRLQLETENFTQFPIVADGNEIVSVSMEDAIRSYLWDFNNAIFVAYTNREVLSINLAFRDLCCFGKSTLEKKEPLVLMQNTFIQNTKYFNGDMFTVEAVGREESFNYQINDSDGKTHDIKLGFTDVSLLHVTTNTIVNTSILSHALWKESPEISRFERQALMINFVQRNRHLSRGTPEFRQALRQDSYFNALFVKFGYALTCHKAQGGEWQKVYISLNRPQNDLKTRAGFSWSYTALTRAKEQAYIVGLPKVLSFNSDSPFEFFILFVEQKFLEHGFELIKSKEVGFELQLSIKKDTITSTFKFYRNKKMLVSTITNMNTSKYTEELMHILQQFKGYSLVEAQA